MIVDDDADDRKIFCEIALEIDPSVKYIPFPGGAAALDYLNKNNSVLPDIIFLDVNMPRMNGMQLLEEIKKKKKLSQIPVAVYTTTMNDGYEKQAMRLGANYFLSKPVFFNEIFKTIRYVLDRVKGDQKQKLNVSH